MDAPSGPLLARAARTAWVALGALLVVLATLLAPLDARADEGAPGDPALAQRIEALARTPSAGAPDARIARLEVVVGALDPRLHLAPCQRIEPYVPGNARLWGRTRVGLRCVQGPSPWNVYLPVTVRAWGKGLVASTALAAGTTLAAGDLVEADVDLAESGSPVLHDAALAAGRVLAQPLKPGQPVRQSHLRARQWFAAGDTVHLVASGAGFRLEGEGQALSNGVEGQAARVRTESGRVVTGVPVGERRVELSL